MKHSMQLFFALVILLVLSSITFASHDISVVLTSDSTEFVFFAPLQSISVCQCATALSSVSVTNTGSFTARYDIFVDKEYVTLGTNVVQLNPGESITIPLYVNAPCSKKGTETLQVTATSMYGETKVIQQQIVFANCQNTQVSFPDEFISASVCSPFTSSFTITNIGSFTEEYEVAVGNFAAFATLNTQKVALAPGQSTTIAVYYALPCDVYGTFSLDYAVYATKNDHKVSFVKELFINQSYEFSLVADVPSQVCEKELSSFRFFLTNENDFSDTYSIQTKGPSFLVLKPVTTDVSDSLQEITIAPGETKEFIVELNPQGRKTFGTHEFTIFATSLNGKVTKSLSSSIEVLDCYNFVNHLDVPYKELSLCGLDTFDRPFEVRNTGQLPLEVGLVLEAPDFVSLSDEVIFLEPGTQQSIYLEFTDVPDANEQYAVVVKSYFRGEFVTQAAVKLFVSTAQECYVVAPVKQELSLRYTKDEFSLPISNEGMRYGWYDVSFTSPVLSVQDAFVDLGVTEKKSVHVSIDADELELLLLMQNASLIGYTLHTDIVFLHDESGLLFVYPLSITFTDYPWITYAWNTIKAQSCCVLMFFFLSAVLIVFLLLGIIFLFSKRIFRLRKTMGFVLLVLMILATLGVFFVWGVPSYGDLYTVHDVETNSTTYLRMVEDKSRTFDLQTFFYDPDDNIVEFGVNSIDETILSYTIANEKLRLTSAKDWSGGTIIQLYAVDSYGERAQSPDIFVEVLPVEDYTLKEFFLKTCVYSNLLLFLLATILCCLLCSLRNRKKELARQKKLQEEAKERAKRERDAKRLANKQIREAKQKAREAELKAKAKKSAKQASADTPK